MTIIDKTFDPAEIEARWYAHWEASGAFRPARPDAEPFTIVIPPPNVTGSLHIGHALDNTLQDVLIRYWRLKGRDARWVVGTDHAGIATQMVVERAIASQGLKRTEMGREAFLANVWEWKETSGGQITRQLRRLGASCDWANERFTMDAGFSAAVTKVFVALHRQGLLYRAKRLVNWDPKLKTAISDLEVETRDVQGSFTHIRYPLADGARLADGRDHLVVATTRPETMLGDTAVAVNPADERYASVVGGFIDHPLTGRRIPIVADDWADPELGSGAVKITPAHDFNDWQVYERHKAIGWINILDAEADIVAADGVPADYVGLSREAARARVTADLEALGLIELVEAKTIQMPFGDRSGVVIEPWLTDQWYVDAKTLAEPALEAVRSGATRFVPKTWEKTYFQWMENIQPWCVSRQLWWGHRIPAWYGPQISEDDSRIDVDLPAASLAARLQSGSREHFVATSVEEAILKATQHYAAAGFVIPVRAYNSEVAAFNAFGRGEALGIWQDEDVLDTWFSSALWPFGTLGWPEQTDVIPAEAGSHLPMFADEEQVAARAPGVERQEMGSRLRGNDEQASGDDLARYYPTDVLVTGFDIIFFWVARMMMMGLKFQDNVPPFHTVYCHGLVRDAKGQKMSKSRGNTVDPLGLIDRFGADALRFTLTAMETQGRDIKLDDKRIEGYRNFATKLWNAARFAQSNGIGGWGSIEPPPARLAVNRWIIGEVATATAALDGAVAAFRFDDYADTIYRLVWSRFCDWYVELTKPLLADGADEDSAAETRAVAGWALDQLLVLLHPVMPFLTEELWHKLRERPYDLILAQWPTVGLAHVDAEASAEIDWLITLTSDVRGARSELNIPPGARLSFSVGEAGDLSRGRLSANALAIATLARASEMPDTGASGGMLQLVSGDMMLKFPLEGVIDLAAERARLGKAADAAEAEAAKTAARLGSPAFVERAKPEVVEENRARLAALTAEAERLRAALARLG